MCNNRRPPCLQGCIGLLGRSHPTASIPRGLMAVCLAIYAPNGPATPPSSSPSAFRRSETRGGFEHHRPPAGNSLTQRTATAAAAAALCYMEVIYQCGTVGKIAQVGAAEKKRERERERLKCPPSFSFPKLFKLHNGKTV